jgi:hypothetical protein
MAYVSTVLPNSEIRIPRLPRPKLRWPRLSRRGRALLMIGVMISPAFLADEIGYGVMRLFMTADQIAARAPDSGILARVRMFPVACMDANIPAGDRAYWDASVAQHGWPRYPEAGPECFRPDRPLLGVVGLKAFNVACPTMVLSVADQRRWVAYAANRGWTDYPQAGEGCVDP